MAGVGNGSRSKGGTGRSTEVRKKVPGAREGRTNSYDTKKTGRVQNARDSRENTGSRTRSSAARTARGKAPVRRTASSSAERTRERQEAASRADSARENDRVRSGLGRESEVRRAIYLVIAGLIAVLCFVSFLGLCGKFGDIVNDITFGFMGSLAYVFPFALFGISAFFVFTGRKCKASKVVCMIGLAILIAALLQLAIGGYEPGLKFLDNFTNSSPGYTGATKTYGGLFGGAIAGLMCKYLGKVATVVILVALAIILLLLISGEAIIAYIKEAKNRPAKPTRSTSGTYGGEEEGTEPEDYDDYGEGSFGRRVKTRRIKDSDDIYVEDDFMRDEPEVRRKIRLQSPVVIEKVPMRADSDDDLLLFDEKNKDKDIGFIDSLKKRGKEMLRDRDGGETPEEHVPSREDREEMRKAAYDLEEIGKMNGPEDEEEDEDDGDDGENALYMQELKRKYGNKPKIDVPKLKRSEYSDAIIIGHHSSGNGYYVDDPEAADMRAREERNSEDETPTGPKIVSFDPSRTGDRETEDTAGNEHRGSFEEHGSEAYAANDAATPSGEGRPEEAATRTRKTTKKTDAAETGAAVAKIGEEIEDKETEVVQKYVFPPITLLERSSGKAKTAPERELKETARKLEETFESFGVAVTVTDVSCGPSVTRYELHPEQGVKVSRITALADDIKLALAAADIRIEAPIPGKSAVGIEIPNKENTMVRLRDLIETEDFEKHKSNIAFAVGKDIGGKTVVTDIAKMPHLLIAGATGSGKSVCINTLIMSIIYKADPADVKMIMVDPKVVELNVYNGIPHLLIPVVTDPKKASAALNWAVAEMTNRYNLFAGAGVRDLEGYNKKIEAEMKKPRQEGEPELLLTKLPQIVIIIDELADLMMVAPGEVEDAICRLAQLARAAGLHLVIATQRPSVNVITGLIKANVPSRIAFAVSSAIDSRTIIDSGGAEKLLGRGDMLFFPSGYPKPVRLQGAYVSDKEVSDVVDFLKSSSENETVYSEEITKHIEQVQTADPKGQTVSDDGRDEYFAEAGKFIIEKEKASIGLLQRVFKIGFNRAARIMDQLAEAGVVGEEEGTKPRKILMTQAEFEQFLGGKTD